MAGDRVSQTTENIKISSHEHLVSSGALIVVQSWKPINEGLECLF
jgi:hypothetical protein